MSFISYAQGTSTSTSVNILYCKPYSINASGSKTRNRNYSKSYKVTKVSLQNYKLIYKDKSRYLQFKKNFIVKASIPALKNLSVNDSVLRSSINF